MNLDTRLAKLEKSLRLPELHEAPQPDLSGLSPEEFSILEAINSKAFYNREARRWDLSRIPTEELRTARALLRKAANHEQ